jgi:hypothetical protein
MAASGTISDSRRDGTAGWQERPRIAYPLLLLVAVLLVLPANFGRPLLHDSFAIDWVWADQFTAQLAHGNLYPRWLPLSYGGLGAPVFYYYPPLAFHLVGLFGLLGLPTYWSVIAGFAGAFAGSGIGCWYWLRARSNHPLLAALFFMAAPYHLFDYTVRGALAESVAIALIPVIAIGLRRIAERRGGVLFTAVAYGAIIGTHLPLALLVSIFLIAPYALVHRDRLWLYGVACAGGVGLAAIYLVPALVLAPYHDVGQLYRAPYLRTHYWSLFAGNWSDGTFTTVFVIIAAMIAAAARPALRRERWALYAVGIAIVVTGIIPLLWSLPLLADVQFPYRALPLAEFGLATAVARLPRRPGLDARLAALPLLLSLFIVRGFDIHGTDLGFLRSRHPDVYEYLPKGVLARGQTSARLKDVLATRIPPPKVAGMVVEPLFYFPAWSCGVEEPRTRLLMHRPGCTPRLSWTRPEQIGGAISLVTALMMLIAAFAARAGSVFQAAARGLRARCATSDWLTSDL